ncbi:unnamed protein product [Rhodiola kirilowii]
MAQSPSEESPSACLAGTSESNIQPFFVLHKASARKPEKKAPVMSPGKTRRKIELSPAKLRHCNDLETGSRDGDNESCREHLRMEAFSSVWSKIESTIQDVLRKFNVNIFDDIYRWVCVSFEAIQSCQKAGHIQAHRSYPIVTDVASKQIFIGFVLTKNMDFVDDLLTFHDLGVYLKSNGCHVANLSSMDFSVKAGIGGCLKSMLRQFLTVSSDAADISVLASWYKEQGGISKPMVIIIDDMERCCGSVLADFILMLSEWALKLPIILVMGVSTTVDTARKILTSNVLHYFSPSKFLLGSPAEKMDAIVEAVLVNHSCGFNIGYKVAAFMRSYFLRQDGTLTSFIRALKIGCVQYFSRQPSSNGFISLLVEDAHGMVFDMNSSLPEAMLKKKLVGQTGEKLAHSFAELKRRQNGWSSMLMCLHEAGKTENIQLLDLFCEALDPELHKSLAGDKTLNLEREFGAKMSDDHCLYQHSFRKSGFIHQTVNRVRDLHVTQLSQLLENWERRTANINEINEKVKELHCSIISDDGKSSKQESINASKRITSRSPAKKGKETTNKKATALIKSLVRDYMRPFEELQEVDCFNNADNLQSAMIGDPRRQIQVDLLDVQKILKCSCCSKKGSILLPTMHDTSVLYTLAQEHGDLINLHDWYQSFKTIINPIFKDKSKKKKASTPKKRKAREEEPASISEATIQARFCRAVIELQITGLLRMPSKRRPDYVQRVAFGL